jgi:flagellar biosynthesis/type III secretory pathway ATPase
VTRLAHQLAALDRAAPLRLTGRLTRVSGLALEAAMAGLKLGSLVEVDRAGSALLAEVVGLREDRAVLIPLGDPAGVGLDAEVRPRGSPLTVGVGESVLGRVLDGLGHPIDGGAPLSRLEPFGMLILIGFLIILPLAGAQFGLNLDVISAILRKSTGFVIQLLLVVTGNT